MRKTGPMADRGPDEGTPGGGPEGGDPAEVDPVGPAELPPAAPHPKWLLPLIGASIVALVIANNVGNAVWASWINERPLELLALNSSNKYLIGTTPNTGWAAVMLVSTLRPMAPDPLFYLVGYLYRDRAVHWARRVFPASGTLFDSFESDEGSFTRLLDGLVFVMPNNPVCLIAGVVGMNVRRFAVLAVAGTIGRIILMRAIGTVFSDQIEDLLEVVARYQRGLLILSIALVVVYVLWQVRSHRGLIGGVEDLEEELGD